MDHTVFAATSSSVLRATAGMSVICAGRMGAAAAAARVENANSRIIVIW